MKQINITDQNCTYHRQGKCTVSLCGETPCIAEECRSKDSPKHNIDILCAWCKYRGMEYVEGRVNPMPSRDFIQGYLNALEFAARKAKKFAHRINPEYPEIDDD